VVMKFDKRIGHASNFYSEDKEEHYVEDVD